MYFTSLYIRLQKVWEYIIYPSKYYAKKYAKKYAKEYNTHHFPIEYMSPSVSE